MSVSAIRDTVVAIALLALKAIFASGSKAQTPNTHRRSSISSLSSISSISSISSNSSSESLHRNQLKDESLLRTQIALNILDATSKSLCTRRWEETTIAKCSQLPLVLDHFKHHDTIRFRRNLRVNPTTFDTLCYRLQNPIHPIFTNKSCNYQLPVKYQVAIALGVLNK